MPVLARFPSVSIDDLRSSLVWLNVPIASDTPQNQAPIPYVAEPLDVIIVRATWRPGDERLFLIVNGLFLLDDDDHKYIKSFPFVEIFRCSSGIEEVWIAEPLSILIKNARTFPGALHNILLPVSSRGNQSFAYGHFVSEVIPDAFCLLPFIDSSSTPSSLLVFPLEEWSKSVLLLAGVPLNSFSELPVSCYNNTYPYYSTYRASVQFYQSNRDHSLIYMASRLLSTLDKSYEVTSPPPRLVIINRTSIAANRPIRWENISEIERFHGSSLFKDVINCDPATLLPEAFYQFYLYRGLNAFVTAPGSGAYNPLIFSSCPVFMGLSSLSLSDLWAGQLTDFKPFSSRIFFLSNTLTAYATDWDARFSLEIESVLEIIDRLYKYFVWGGGLFSTDPLERATFKHGSVYYSIPLISAVS